MRRSAHELVLVTAGLLLTGCSPESPPVAVAAVDGEPAVVWKFCDGDRGVGSVTVARVTDDDPEHWPLVWRARLEPDAAALDRLPLRGEVDGYVVETGQDWPLRADVQYAVTDAADTDGVSVLASVPDFDIQRLRRGDVVADPASDLDLNAWLGPDGPPCQ